MRIVARLVGSLILFAAVAVSVLVATPRTAHASCAVMELSEYAHLVDVAFVGRQVPPAIYAGHLERESRKFIEFVTVFEVERVYKGQVGPIEGVHSTPGLPSVPTFELGTHAVVAFENPDGTLSVSDCYDNLTIAELEEEFGPGYPPAGSNDQQDEAERLGTAAEPGSGNDGRELQQPPETRAESTSANLTSVDPQQPPEAPAEPTSDDAPAVEPAQSPETRAEPASDDLTAVDPRQPPDDGSARPNALVVALLTAAAAALLIGSILAVRRRRHRPPPAG